MIQVHPKNYYCLLSVIYTSNDFSNRRSLWNNLENISNAINDPWLIAGDFNEILTQSDKWGGRHINNRKSLEFWSYINHCNLLDLGHKVSKYTWSNYRRHNKGIILERLDRAFTNNSWTD